MAEIPIERKQGTNWLPIILGALVLLALLGWCATRNRAPEAVVTPADTTGAMTGTAAGGTMGAATGGAAVTDFVNYTTARDTALETEGNHQYTAGGVRRLATALDETAGGNPNIAVYADSMRSAADRMGNASPNDDSHANDAKAAFSAAVSAMEQIDRARGRTRDVAPMRAIYTQLDSGRPLLPQLPTVQRFFDAAREALQAMGAAS